MADRTLYKYLSIDGGLKMLEHSNLQFANAVCLNDPFDCHPALFRYDVPQVFVVEDDEPIPTSESLVESDKKDMEKLRDSTWICSLSKIKNSLLMWTHYCQCHQGVCVGLNIERVKSYLCAHLDFPYRGPKECEVYYDTFVSKPNYALSDKGYLDYQASTKALEWSYEQEVRLVVLNLTASTVLGDNSCRYRTKDGLYLVRNPYRPTIDSNCFESVYLGVRISPTNRNKVIKAARAIKPNINIYQMTIDPEALRLKEELVKY